MIFSPPVYIAHGHVSNAADYADTEFRLRCVTDKYGLYDTPIDQTFAFDQMLNTKIIRKMSCNCVLVLTLYKTISENPASTFFGYS